MWKNIYHLDYYLRITFSNLRFSVPGSSVGLFCSTPGVPLARVVPRKMSAYMLLTGIPITAPEALRSGLVNNIFNMASSASVLIHLR